MQTALQAAFAAARTIPARPVKTTLAAPLAHPPSIPRPRPVKAVAALRSATGARLVPFDTLTPHYPLALSFPEARSGNSDSREPPEHEPNFAERYFP